MSPIARDVLRGFGGLVATLILSLFLGNIAATSWADKLAGVLGRVVSHLPQRTVVSPDVRGRSQESISPCQSPSAPSASVLAGRLRRPRTVSKGRRPGRTPRHDLKPTGGLLARRDVVRAAARAGIRPSASFVAASADHPAGLLVNGWQAAGAGFRDGDIIVKVAGAPARSVGQVIGAVVAAYEHKTYAISGLIWRGGHALSATVELPIPRAPVTKPSNSRPSASVGRRGDRSAR